MSIGNNRVILRARQSVARENGELLELKRPFRIYPKQNLPRVQLLATVKKSPVPNGNRSRKNAARKKQKECEKRQQTRKL